MQQAEKILNSLGPETGHSDTRHWLYEHSCFRLPLKSIKIPFPCYIPPGLSHGPGAGGLAWDTGLGKKVFAISTPFSQ